MTTLESAPNVASAAVPTGAGNDDPPPLVKGSVKRLLAWVFPATAAIFMLWGAVPGLLLPRQLELFDAPHKVGNLAIVSTLGAFGGMIAAPIAGQLSDRTRRQFGRRAPWILIGATAGALTLVGLAFANTLVGVAIAWTLVQICYNFAQAPLSAILPDRIPLRRRGTFATIAGIALMTGTLGGSVIGSVLFNSIAVGYVILSVTTLAALSLFVVFNPDHSSVDLQVEPFRLSDFLRTFWISPVKHPDFFWAFIARLLLFTGYGIVTGYQLYILTDYLGLAHPETVIPVLGVIGLVGIITSTVISGPVSDRIGRRKPFVFGSSAVMGLGLILPWLWPTLVSWGVLVGIIGLGFGMYLAVDTALMSEVLPSAQSFAKDLGIVNIAAALPQTISPALAGAVVLRFGYAGLFPLGVVLSLLGAVAIWPIKTVR
jgi:MFS family permease